MVDLAEGTNNDLILKWTERLTIDAQKKVVTKSSKDRIIAIDWWKGFAIIWITAYHLGVEWVLPQDMWIVRFVIVMGLWFVGPPTFLFFAGVNITLSYRLGLERKLSYNQLYYETFRRMMGLYLVSLVWNLITDISPVVPYTGISIIFRWEILQCIVFSTLLTFPLLKHSIHTRLIIAVLILAISYPFYNLLELNQAQSPLARGLILALFFPYLTSPLFPTIAYTIMGSVVIDLIFPIIKKIRQPRTSGENSKVGTGTFKILLI
ncbi:MAG TPA: heparan-alpha-glucosaminide N-acetyltransferase domain-containing protein, partial [Candidatus Lokiarchaeia archaeon]|nr:heparan-alpha-glucosaminide N-acetyltransferase domain-containing protein [Candidatus Lokiarchaeia archaeon]